MANKELKNIRQYLDSGARENGEPGICHSYMISLATALDFISEDFDPVWLMGSSAFAFRIFVNETMCPSAMSMFDFSSILPDAVEQAGYHCTYISRLWDEADMEEERRREAHKEIRKALDANIPAVVWDIAQCEWGLIIGYSEEKSEYKTLTCTGEFSVLGYDKLGQNDIRILSVAIPSGPNNKSQDKTIFDSLATAVTHAEQKEWADRPAYQNGLAAFDLWALTYERWAMLVEAGKAEKINVGIPGFAAYYSVHYYSARCYARDYLLAISGGNKNLEKASESYGKVAKNLKLVWANSPRDICPDGGILRSIAQNIKDAKAAEEEGLVYIKEYLREAGWLE